MCGDGVAVRKLASPLLVGVLTYLFHVHVEIQSNLKGFFLNISHNITLAVVVRVSLLRENLIMNSVKSPPAKSNRRVTLQCVTFCRIVLYESSVTDVHAIPVVRQEAYGLGCRVTNATGLLVDERWLEDHFRTAETLFPYGDDVAVRKL